MKEAQEDQYDSTMPRSATSTVSLDVESLPALHGLPEGTSEGVVKRLRIGYGQIVGPN